MEIDRRSLLLGLGFAGLTAGAAAPARACTMEIVSPLEGRFWTRLWTMRVTRPRQERQLALRFIAAIAHRSAEELESLLAPGALTFQPPDGSPHWERPGRRYDRSETLQMLLRATRRQGSRQLVVHHFRPILRHSEFLIDATVEGYGAPDDSLNPYGICGEDPNAWERRIVLVYRVDNAVPGEALKVQTLLWLG